MKALHIPTNCKRCRPLKVLAEPNRLLILHLLWKACMQRELGDRCKGPQLDLHHLSVLRQAGLVDVERDAVDAR